MIGDCIGVKSMAVEGLQMIVEYVAQGPGDAACWMSTILRSCCLLQRKTR